VSTLIYCFSGSGNSWYVAKNLAEKLRDCRVVKIETTGGTCTVAEPSDSIGLVLPTYFGGPPAMVKTFIEQCLTPIASSISYLFVIYTHGGLPAYVSAITERLLATATLVCSYADTVKMVDTYIPYFTIPDEDAQQRIFAKVDKKIALIAEKVSKETISILRRPLFSQVFQLWWEKHIVKLADRDERYVVTDECTGCGLCERRCPAGNITIQEGKPVFHHHCEQCFGCYHVCPFHAIRLQSKPLRGYTWYPNTRSHY